MAFGNWGRELVRSNESWTDTSVEGSNRAITTRTHVIVGQAGTISTPLGLPLETFLIKLPLIKNRERRLSLPPQVEVDAYINSLEHALAAEQKRKCQVEDTEKIRFAEAPHTRTTTFWWWVVAAVIGCIYWVLSF